MPMKVGYSKKFVPFLFVRYLFMKSIVWNLASVIVATLFIPFLIHTDVKAQTTVNICNRTAAVETAILAAISDTNDCTMVTDTQLTAITELDLSGQGIDSLQSGDFAGLSGLTTLNLSVNRLTTLPAGLFSGLTNLVGVDSVGQSRIWIALP